MKENELIQDDDRRFQMKKLNIIFKSAVYKPHLNNNIEIAIMSCVLG